MLQGKLDVHLYESKHKERNQINAHFHYTHQILYVLDGEGECVLEEEVSELKPDSMIIIRPLTPHSIQARSKMTVLVLEFDETRLSFNYKVDLIAPVFDQSKVLRLNLFEGSEVRQLLRKMLYEQARERHDAMVGIKLLLGQFLFLLTRMQQSVYQDTNHLRAKALKDFIDANYYQLTNAEEMAAKMGVSSRYMHQIFKESYDVTAMRYVTEVRLNRVKQMLTDTELDIVSICFEVGFESLSTFYRVFKQHVGVSPLVYRNTYVKLD